MNIAPKYLSAAEAGRYLGVSKRTFFVYVRDSVRATKIGARIVFKVDELDRWAEAHSEGGPARVAEEPAPIELPAPNEVRQRILNELESLPDMQRMSKKTRELIAKLGRS